MSRRTSHNSAIRLLRYPAGQAGPPHTTFTVDGSLALATGPPLRRPSASTDATVAAEVIMRLYAEAFTGRRPVRHLSGWVTLEVWEELIARRPSVRSMRRVPPPRVLTSWARTPVPDAAEAGGVVQLGDRVHAIALRLERFRRRWRCTALETTIPAA
jgi:hypothetical protein